MNIITRYTFVCSITSNTTTDMFTLSIKYNLLIACECDCPGGVILASLFTCCLMSWILVLIHRVKQHNIFNCSK